MFILGGQGQGWGSVRPSSSCVQLVRLCCSALSGDVGSKSEGACAAMPLKDNPFMQQDQQRRAPPLERGHAGGGATGGGEGRAILQRCLATAARPQRHRLCQLPARRRRRRRGRVRRRRSRPTRRRVPTRTASARSTTQFTSCRRWRSRTLCFARWRRRCYCRRLHSTRCAPGGLSARGAALVANGRRREAVLSLKLRALQTEVRGFRERERDGIQANQARGRSWRRRSPSARRSASSARATSSRRSSARRRPWSSSSVPSKSSPRRRRR